jgi:hypothetical protein
MTKPIAQPPASDHGQAFVEITVDSKKVRIHRGRQTVAHIKEVGGVPKDYDLDQIVDGKLVPLGDNDSVVIKSEEVFVSHPKDGASS